jgi:fructose-1,6-bisphosphatase/inositol monophosphatase family enzyme
LLAAPLGSPSHAISASEKDKISDFVVSLALSGRSAVGRSRAVRKVIRISRSMGSAALALAYVGNGRFDAFIQQGGLSAWDVAAAGLIAERGGARVTAMDGGPWFDLARKPASIGILSAPVAHHGTFLELVR